MKARILVLILLSLITVKPTAKSSNDQSRMATIQSLVEHHSFIIDESPFNKTKDKVFIRGHFYSDKPVAASIIGAIVYLPLHYLGIRFDRSVHLVYYLITLFTIKLFYILGLVAFYFSLQWSKIEEKYRIWLTCALGFSSLYLTWSCVFNNHLLSASFLSIGYYYYLKSKYEFAYGRYIFSSAFFFSLAGVTDNPVAIVYIGFLILSLFHPVLREKIHYYLIPLLLTAIPTIYLNYAISGSVLPFTIHKSFFEYPGSIWTQSGPQSEQLSGVAANSGFFVLSYSIGMLLGPKGFMLYNPLLFIALTCLLMETRGGRMFRKEAIVIGLSSFILVLYYIFMTSNYSGSSYSIRWFVPLLPLFFFFCSSYFEKYTNKRHYLFWSLSIISSIIAFIGAMYPWSPIELNAIPIISNIKLYLFDPEKCAFYLFFLEKKVDMNNRNFQV